VFIFSVKYLQEKKLNKFKGYDIKAILATLSFLSNHTWKQIIVGKVKKYHEVPLVSVKVSIANHHKTSERQEIGVSDKSLISFAYKSEGRILGFRKNNEFFITYIDINHDYC
jgi:hypothetical protein